MSVGIALGILLAALFSQGGYHHIPILDEQQRLVGIVTQTDLLRTLASVVQAHPT